MTVRKGPAKGAAVIVLDPGGEARHYELPATWRPIAEDVAVVWCRLPSAKRQGLTSEYLFKHLVLNRLVADRDRLYLVGAGKAALLTLSLAITYRDRIHDVLLVDPPWPSRDLPNVRRIAADSAPRVHQVYPDTATNGAPIGHPAVVRTIIKILISTDAGLEASVKSARNGPPVLGSLLPEAWRALRVRLANLLDAVMVMHPTVPGSSGH